MKTEIDLSAIESALIKLGDATARQIADKTGLETKDVTRALNAMLKSATVEREHLGREYVYWLTTTATTKPTAKPRAAAVAVHAALEGGTDPAPDLAEQLRQAHAERLAMSQTIIAICCAIGRDPGQTTTADLPQALRDYIAAEVSGATLDLLSVIADIRAAIGDADRIMQSDLAAHIKAELDSGKQAREEATRLHLACNGLTNDLMEPAGPFYDQAQGLRAAAMLIDAQQAHILQLEEHVSELRSRIEAQILAGHNSASSANRLLTEVHEVLSTAWPEGWPQPGARTTLQLAQALKIDFGVLYGEHLDKQAAAPDAYLVTRHLRAGRGKTVADSDGPTRHKSIETATRKARAAIRGGYVRAEIHAINLVAVATAGAEIKPA